MSLRCSTTSNMFPVVLFLLLLSFFVFLVEFSAAENDGVMRRSKNRPTAFSGPLTPSLQCSACEMTVRELHAQYSKRSVHDKFYGTEVEIVDVTTNACEQLELSRKYYLAQENFGARLKVFAKVGVHEDIQTTETAQFYSARDEERYVNAVHRLKKFCESMVEKFYTSHITRHIVERSDEQTLRYQMCYVNATHLCEVGTLLPYRQIEERKRRRWKKAVAAAELEKKMEQELSEKLSQQQQRGGGSDADVESMTDL